MDDFASSTLVPAAVTVESKTAAGFQASTLFGLNPDAHCFEKERKGDFGPGNKLIGISSSLQTALKGVVSWISSYRR